MPRGNTYFNLFNIPIIFVYLLQIFSECLFQFRFVNGGISKYIPHKLAKSTNRKPWVSRETVRLLRQRNRAYNKQKSGLQEDRDRYKYFKE